MTNDKIHLVLSRQSDEGFSQRRREAFLMSVLTHLLIVLFIILGPRILPRRQPPDSVDQEPAKRLGFLALPRDYQKILRKPPTPKLSDKNRTAQGQAPEIDPKGLRIPYSKGNTKRPLRSQRRRGSRANRTACPPRPRLGRLPRRQQRPNPRRKRKPAGNERCKNEKDWVPSQPPGLHPPPKGQLSSPT